ncbi:MAG: UDP-glucose--hexose-1-phosphate uridylyltransferase [Suipraeoptans sp.]
MIGESIYKLVEYGVRRGLLPESERIYTINLLLDIMNETLYQKNEVNDDKDIELVHILEELLDKAVKRQIITDDIVARDLFDTRLMNALLPRPNQVSDEFWKKYNEESKESATDYYYKFSEDSNYIRRDRIAKDMKWKSDSQYGKLDITINLSKPEKDPKAIAAALGTNEITYPKCQLCMENEGYAGRIDYPARQTHRIIHLNINNSDWGFQYSPYVYYNEHCIAFNGKHVPMQINKDTFVKLIDFIKIFPHYFIGSNADLPIVGGSILTHDHFQGGRYTFAMEKAPIIKTISINSYRDIDVGIVKWPMSVIRISGKDERRLISLADHILKNWINYSDQNAFIFANSNGERHNTITPIARYKNNKYELDLVLRNNITTEEYPLGVFHPHSKHHNIKKENIGLIEVMGLAVLPARLKNEMEELSEYLITEKSISDIRNNENISKHADWLEQFIRKYDSIHKDNVWDILKKEIGNTFTKVLENSGVFKQTETGLESFTKFMNTL